LAPRPPSRAPGGGDAAPPPLPVAALGPAERLACLRLIRSENVGPATFRRIVNLYGGAEEALAALPALARQAGRRHIRICPREAAEAELEAAEASGAVPLFNIEPGFPKLLALLDGAPPLLYCRGKAGLLDRPAVAIVGARDGSALGQKLARQMAGEIGRAGYVIVSGLARGIDGAAHQAALETGTVAVLAGGLDVVYPPEHAALQAEIAERGCLISEQPPGFVARGQDFPRRNRIISGISLAVLVVEAARRSGTLITARMAAEQGREVMAVPGHPLDPRAEGTNQLLKDGATLVTSADDVLAVLAPMAGTLRPHERLAAADSRAGEAGPRPGTVPPGPLAPGPDAPPLPLEAGDQSRAAVRSALGPAPAEVDEIARATGLAVRTVNVVLIELALAGEVTFHGQQLVSLARPGR
jgi:DNA processing protein